jgi:hypothetical protein
MQRMMVRARGKEMASFFMAGKFLRTNSQNIHQGGFWN